MVFSAGGPELGNFQLVSKVCGVWGETLVTLISTKTQSLAVGECLRKCINSVGGRVLGQEVLTPHRTSN